MWIVQCPECGDRVRVDEQLPGEARVQCPLCLEEFAMERVLIQLPPPLVIVQSADDQSVEGFELRTDQEEPPPFQFETAAEPSPEPVPAASATAAASRRRASKAGKNPLVEIGKIVLGGLVGLLIGQLILWWMPGDWEVAQRDPLAIGRKFGSSLPWIVPSQIRGEPASAAASTGDGASSDLTDWSIDPDDINALLDQPGSEPRGAAPGSAGAGEATRSGQTAEDRPPASFEVPRAGLRNASAVPPDELLEKFREAQELEKSIPENAEQVTAEQIGKLRAAVRELAYAVTYVHPPEEVPDSTLRALRRWLRRLDAPHLQPLREPADPVTQGGHEGGWVLGTVDDIRLNGELFETHLLGSDGRPWVVISRRDPRDSYSLDERVLVLGVWLDDPERQLEGLAGLDRTQVLFGGFPAVMPPAIDRSPAGPQGEPSNGADTGGQAPAGGEAAGEQAVSENDGSGPSGSSNGESVAAGPPDQAEPSGAASAQR